MSGIFPLVAISSVGCRTNQEEMAELRDELEQTGFAVIEDVKTADIVIVNTCSVTSIAESKVRRLLRAISRESPGSRILVTGCFAQQQPEVLLAFPNVSWVVGNSRKHEIPSILVQKREGVFVSDLTASPLVLPGSIHPPGAGKRTRFAIKIQEGCDYRCAYCIVPFLRGPSRSASMAGIVESCSRALDAGFKEIVLTGTHTGQFRAETGERLIDLVGLLLELDGDFRLRLSSLDPRELTDELCDIIGSGGKMCDHLHISLQSLSPEVLQRMSRPYASFDSIVDRLKRFRAKYPDAGLGADFIVGFPGETEACFMETAGCAEQIGFSYAHLFRFSVRPGTEAFDFEDRVPEPVKHERSGLLRTIIGKSREMFIGRQVGRTHRIIVEQEHPLRGMTANFLSVEAARFSFTHNRWIDVIIDGTIRNGRFCTAHPVRQETL